MENVITYKFNTDVNPITKNILDWKLKNPLETLQITYNDDIVTANNASYVSSTNTVCEQNNSLSSISINSISEFLTAVSIMGNSTVEDDFEIVSNNDFLIDIANDATTCNKTNVVKVSSAIHRNNNMLFITVRVLKTKYIFELIIDSQYNININFVKTKPYILFEKLMRDHIKKFGSNVSISTIINYIAECILSDQDEHKDIDPDINDLVYDMYLTYDITIRQYLWEDSEVTCPLCLYDLSPVLLCNLNKLYMVLKDSVVTTKHLYIIVPILSYYIHITDHEIIINNMAHYSILMQIIKLFDSVWDVTISSDISKLCSQVLSENHNNEVDLLMLDYIERFTEE